MIEKRLVWVLLLISQFTFSQIKGVVKDSLTGNPIPYVNIWVENENIGTTSEENGTFEIKTSKEKNLVFSVIGFETKICKLSETSEIILNPIVYQLDNVEIAKLKNTKELEIGDSKKIHHKHLSGDKPWIYGKLFTYEPKYSETPYLKEIVFLSDSEKNVVDISKFKIKMPNNGIVIGLEWLIIEENKYLYEYTYNKVKQSTVNYAPSLVINYSEVENSFRYSGGKWKKSKINKTKIKETKPWDNKVMAPAINLILTN